MTPDLKTTLGAWRDHAGLGYCAPTTGPGDCDRGELGVLGMRFGSGALVPPRLRAIAPLPNLSDAILDCLGRCALCDRCRYISLSLQNADCSWYRSCKMRHLRTDASGFISGPSLKLLHRLSNGSLDDDLQRRAARAARAPDRSKTSVQPQFSRTCAPDAGRKGAKARQRPLDLTKKMPRKARIANIALLRSTDGPFLSSRRARASSDGRDLAENSTWAGRDAPCSMGLLELMIAATNREYAWMQGYDFYEGRADCKREVGRAPTWCKVAMIYGLLDEPYAYRRVIYLDTDAAMNTQRSLREWLELPQGKVPKGKVRSNRAGDGGADLSIASLLTSACHADSHRANELKEACVILGKDVPRWPGVNAGIVIATRTDATLDLLRRWWAWPLAAAEGGNLSARRFFELEYSYDQMALNAVADSVLLGSKCVRVVPSYELYEPPALLTRHFSGDAESCPVDEAHAPADGSTLPYGATRKCLCFLSHFGAEAVASLFRTEDFDESACGDFEVTIRPGGGGPALPATFRRHSPSCALQVGKRGAV